MSPFATVAGPSTASPRQAVEPPPGAVFSRSDATGSSLALIALFVLWTLGLLVGIAGGLRAFRDRQGFP